MIYCVFQSAKNIFVPALIFRTSFNLEVRTGLNFFFKIINIFQHNDIALTFTLLLIPREDIVARFQSKASITDTVITALCVDACCILTTNHFLLTFVNIYIWTGRGHKEITLSYHCSTVMKRNTYIYIYTLYITTCSFFYSEGTDRHLTSTCDIVTVAKTFHSRGNESITTNAGIMWNCVKTFGIRSTQADVLQTLIDILKQKIKTALLYLDD